MQNNDYCIFVYYENLYNKKEVENTCLKYCVLNLTEAKIMCVSGLVNWYVCSTLFVYFMFTLFF